MAARPGRAGGRRATGLAEVDRDEIELEENLQRKDLTAIERAKTLVKLAETAKTVLREEPEFRGESPRNGTGRPSQPDSSRAVAERIGVPAKTIREAQQHVETARSVLTETCGDSPQVERAKETVRQAAKVAPIISAKLAEKAKVVLQEQPQLRTDSVRNGPANALTGRDSSRYHALQKVRHSKGQEATVAALDRKIGPLSPVVMDGATE